MKLWIEQQNDKIEEAEKKDRVRLNKIEELNERTQDLAAKYDKQE